MLGRDQQAQDDQDAEPEGWHGNPGDGKCPYHIVDPGVLFNGGNDAQRDGDDDRDSCRHDGDLQGKLETQADLVDDGEASPHRVAQVKDYVTP